MSYISRISRGDYYEKPQTNEYVGPGSYLSPNSYNINNIRSPFNTTNPRNTLVFYEKNYYLNPGIFLI